MLTSTVFSRSSTVSCSTVSLIFPFCDPTHDSNDQPGTQFSYLGEIFPTHLRAKGVCLGVAMISLMNIIWLQSAPTAFAAIGWKFYLAFIIPGSIGAIIMWFYFPDTLGLPLEEVAAIFGDADEVAVYQRDIEIDFQSKKIVDRRVSADGKMIKEPLAETEHVDAETEKRL